MQNLPHHYTVTAAAGIEGNVALSSQGLAQIDSAPPAEFGGPGDRWSPETLQVAAIADCFILTFRAIAQASRFEWGSISCDVTGTLDRVEKVTQFIEFQLNVVLHVPSAASEQTAIRLLEKAERSCLISNSLKAQTHLHAKVNIATAG